MLRHPAPDEQMPLGWMISEVPPGAHPVAEIEFQNKMGGQPPVKLSVALKERCCGDRFYGPVRVPAEAANGTARVRLSLPDWQEGKVAPATFEVPVTDGSVVAGSSSEKPAPPGVGGLPVGTQAPEIEGEDLDGQKFKLSDCRGKVTAVVFWASWCGPCMRMVPKERALVDRLKGKPFVLVGVNGDPEREDGRKAAEKTGMTWRSFWNGGDVRLGGIVEAWKVGSWPTVYVLDAKGVVRSMCVGGDGVEEAVDHLLAEAERKK